MSKMPDVASIVKYQVERWCNICCKTFRRPETKRQHDIRQNRKARKHGVPETHPACDDYTIGYQGVLSKRMLS